MKSLVVFVLTLCFVSAYVQLGGIEVNVFSDCNCDGIGEVDISGATVSITGLGACASSSPVGTTNNNGVVRFSELIGGCLYTVRLTNQQLCSGYDNNQIVGVVTGHTTSVRFGVFCRLSERNEWPTFVSHLPITFSEIEVGDFSPVILKFGEPSSFYWSDKLNRSGETHLSTFGIVGIVLGSLVLALLVLIIVFGVIVGFMTYFVRSKKFQGLSPLVQDGDEVNSHEMIEVRTGEYDKVPIEDEDITKYDGNIVLH